jgi:Domain of unknown function (DUF4815)
MALNFNVDPYYDDFDPTKNYHRILFKPGVAVQARELTQSQTILQNQISNFADNIFKQNTPVTGGQVTTNLKSYYLKLNTTYNGQNIVAANFLNQLITDSTSTIVAKVIAVSEATGTTSSPGDPPTLIVSYRTGVQFSDNMVLSVIGSTNVVATTIGSTGGSTCTGLSSTTSISQGVFYVVNGWSKSSTPNPDGTYSTYSIGTFVNVAPQTVILSKYSNTPSVRIGLEITETIVDYIDDQSLLDPAVGASNYQAPGADRYKIDLTLTTLPLLSSTTDPQFIELVRMDTGQVIKQVDGTVYAVIDDYFAKRDFETNGDYIVNDFKIAPAVTQSSNTTWDLTIGPGVAYVHGYRIENQSSITITSPRAQNTNSVIGNSLHVDYGSYFVTDTLTGDFNFTTMPKVDFHCVPASSINNTNANTYNSTLVGSGFIRNIVYQESLRGTDTTGYVFNTYVNDINCNTLSGTATNSSTSTTLVINDSTGVFSSSNNAYNGVQLVLNSGLPSGVLDSPKTVTNYYVLGSTKTFTVDKSFVSNPTSNTTFSLVFQTGVVESIVQKNGSGAVANTTNINNFGKSNGTANGTTLFFESTAPELIFKIGSDYVASVNSSNYFTSKIFRGQSFNSSHQTSITSPSGLSFASGTLTNAYGPTIAESFIVVNAATGAVLDFTTSGNNVSVSGSTATFTSTVTPGTVVDIIAQMHIPNGEVQVNNILKSKNLVSGSTTLVGTLNSISGTTTQIAVLTSPTGVAAGQTYVPKSLISTSSPFSLYVTDVSTISKIVDLGTTSGAPSSGTSLSSFVDITNNFELDNGQRDSFYDFASLKLRPGVNPPVGDIFVVYNYFSHNYNGSSGDGYFTVNSYSDYTNIPSYTAKNGNIYNLRDCIDFRPSRKNGTAISSYTWEYHDSSTSHYGILIPTAGTQSYYQNNYSFYLSRKDKLILTKDGQFSMVYGSPAINSILPKEPAGTLVLANIYLDPYTAIIPGTADINVPANITINKVLHKRWAKSDITDLETRVNNLEYYTSLSALEASAQSLQIPDSNGLNRFKNGILADDFSNYGVCDSYYPGYFANINIRTKKLSPIQQVENFQLQNPVVLTYGAKSTNTYKIHSISGSGTNIYTLPYTTANVVTQRYASNTISINPFDVTISQGTLTMIPPADNWYNTYEIPGILLNSPVFQFSQVARGNSLLNCGDAFSIVGIATNTTDLTSTGLSSDYQSQLQSLTTSQTSSSSGGALSVNNGFVNNNQVLPYIRPQEIAIISRGMLKNTPVSCWFDGTNVDQYMITPNTIELTNVSGTFYEDDIIGFYESSISQFIPLGRVVSVYYYPGTTNCRIYMTTNLNAPQTTSSTLLINADFDVNGKYTGSTASGNVKFSANSIYSLHTSGTVNNVYGTFTNIGNVVPVFYKTPVVSSTTPTYVPFSGINGFSVVSDNKGTFFNQYAVWGDQSNSTAYNVTNYTVNIPSNGNYTFYASCSGSASITLDGTTILSASVAPAVPSTVTKTLTAGNHTLAWTATSSGTVNSGLAVAITDSSGTVIWNSLSPQNVIVSTVGEQYAMPGGGTYYIDTNKISLDQNASSVDHFYEGCTINISSSYTYDVYYGAVYFPPPPPYSGDGDQTNRNIYNAAVQNYYNNVNSYNTQEKSNYIMLASVNKFTANITNYVGSTRTATLDTGVDISIGYNSQYGILSSTYSIQGTIDNIAGAISGGTGIPKLSTNENGDFVAVFKVPGSEFWTGARKFRVDNRNNDADPNSATTFAEGTFIAGSIQDPNLLSASVDSASQSVQPINYSNAIQTTPRPDNMVDPLAQSFIISKDNYPNGLFLSGVKLFFAYPPGAKTVSDLQNKLTSPVTISVVECVNGYPNGSTLPYSNVTKTAGEIIPYVSTTPHYLDSTTYVEFNFPAPVYVQSGTLYAIIIESNDSDYYLYYAEQNKNINPLSTYKNLPTDANPSSITNQPNVGAAPYVGSLFESQNAITWTADQTKDLMFIIDQCIFDTTQTPVIPFITPPGLPYRKLGHQDIAYNVNPNIVHNGYKTFSPNLIVDSINVTTSDFIPTTTNINYTYQSTLAADLSLTSPVVIYPGKFGSPTQDNVYFDDGLGARYLSNSSNNSFILNATLTSTDSNVSPVLSDDHIVLNAVNSYINNMGIGNNVISIANTGLGYNVLTCSVTASNPDIGSDIALLGYSLDANGTIQDIHCYYPGSGYLTAPTITITGANTYPATANITGEISPKGGNAFARYITKKVVLDPSNESGDLRVYYTAYKPFGSEIYVYYRILNSNDTAQLEDQNWQLMTQVGTQNVYSKTRSDFIEYEWAPGILGSGQANNTISYTSTSGQSFNSYTQFGLKIVMTTSDLSKVPVLNDMRAIALPSGTGL